jgi:hypothetical protein
MRRRPITEMPELSEISEIAEMWAKMGLERR